ncbi:MAG: hypothetical protein DRJ10_02465 [Bacteroidetes bacterium]|nr:MAG: hypothetical protein DRJ10_02465 [Bacteroidota bacterium]
MSIELSDKVRLAGQIGIIHEHRKGFVAYIITDTVNELTWALELRFPIIQNYIANEICNCSAEKVDVGLIDYTSGKEFIANYSNEEIKEAIEELNKIGKVITQELY